MDCASATVLGLTEWRSAYAVLLMVIAISLYLVTMTEVVSNVMPIEELYQ